MCVGVGVGVSVCVCVCVCVGVCGCVMNMMQRHIQVVMCHQAAVSNATLC